MRTRSLLLALLLVSPVGAESPEEPQPRRTVASLQAGFASGSMGSNGTSLGGTIVTDLSPRLALEATGTHHGQGMGADALSASANLQVLLRPRSERTVPYLTLGGGVHRTSFDMGNARFNGPMNGSAAGYGSYGMTGAGYPGSGAGHWNYGSMPVFDASRMGTRSLGPSRRSLLRAALVHRPGREPRRRAADRPRLAPRAAAGRSRPRRAGRWRQPHRRRFHAQRGLRLLSLVVCSRLTPVRPLGDTSSR